MANITKYGNEQNALFEEAIKELKRTLPKKKTADDLIKDINQRQSSLFTEELSNISKKKEITSLLYSKRELELEISYKEEIKKKLKARLEEFDKESKNYIKISKEYPEGIKILNLLFKIENSYTLDIYLELKEKIGFLTIDLDNLRNKIVEINDKLKSYKDIDKIKQSITIDENSFKFVASLAQKKKEADKKYLTILSRRKRGKRITSLNPQNFSAIKNFENLEIPKNYPFIIRVLDSYVRSVIKRPEIENDIKQYIVKQEEDKKKLKELEKQLPEEVKKERDLRKKKVIYTSEKYRMQKDRLKDLIKQIRAMRDAIKADKIIIEEFQKQLDALNDEIIADMSAFKHSCNQLKINLGLIIRPSINEVAATYVFNRKKIIKAIVNGDLDFLDNNT